ncbi:MULTISPECIES: alkane 1-monooxygenase [Burkholderia cepacia complex]|uniref:alkane 1-monooxygenase n=1 Tax=Burkholderia cepacia complex TaxID=87882 RepID=UPI000F080EE4|nr:MULTISPECIES: alkane 1-monooxygenase [Burkholderia cepacia complex]AYQ44140.1 alkane 1-monooxygenase [Burkholderia lata]
MWEYIKYYFAPFVQVLAIWGFYRGGDFTWIAIGAFPAIAILDALLPLDLSERRMKSHFWAYLPVWIATLLLPVMYFVFAWSVGHHALTALQMAGGVAGLAWLSVVPGVPATHELYHSRGRLARFVGRYGQIAFLDCMRMEVHVVGHHRDVGTAEDVDTARRGATLYRFVVRSMWESTRLELKLDADTLEKRGYSRWSIRHSLWRAILAVVVFVGIIHAIGGVKAAGLCFIAMVIARFWVEAFNYYQHFGQTRVVGTPIEKRHVWNHYGTLSRLYAFEITNHAEHHLNSYLPYYKLVPDRQAILMPSIIVCFLSGFIPPLWYSRIIKPALRRWDNEFASPAERRLAMEQNRSVGWEDWFDEPPTKPGKPTTTAWAGS